MHCPLQCSLPLKQVSVNNMESHPSERDSVRTSCENSGPKWLFVDGWLSDDFSSASQKSIRIFHILSVGK